MDLRDVFATNLRRLRNAKGLSQDDLAYEAEVSRSYLSQLEKGSFYASLKIIGRLAEVLDVERKAEFVHHWNGGTPTKEIARLFGFCSTIGVGEARRRLKLPARKR